MAARNAPASLLSLVVVVGGCSPSEHLPGADAGAQADSGCSSFDAGGTCFECSVDSGWNAPDAGGTCWDCVLDAGAIDAGGSSDGDKPDSGSAPPIDGGALLDGGIEDAGLAPNDGGASCPSGCEPDSGSAQEDAGQPALCGDGLIECLSDGGTGYCETCDDGNLLDGDGCSAACTLEGGWICPTAGQACMCTGLPPGTYSVLLQAHEQDSLVGACSPYTGVCECLGYLYRDYSVTAQVTVSEPSGGATPIRIETSFLGSVTLQGGATVDGVTAASQGDECGGFAMLPLSSGYWSLSFNHSSGTLTLQRSCRRTGPSPCGYRTSVTAEGSANLGLPAICPE